MEIQIHILADTELVKCDNEGGDLIKVSIFGWHIVSQVYNFYFTFFLNCWLLEFGELSKPT